MNSTIKNTATNNFTSSPKLLAIPKLIAIVGLTGAGKSVATEFFETKGFAKVRFGQITMDTLNEQGKEINEKNEREVREGLRKELGMGAYAIKNVPKIEALLAKGSDVVADGLYSWAEYKILKEKFGGQLNILAVQSSPAVRYQRLSERKERPLTNIEATSRDYSEIENIEKAGPIAIADYVVINNGGLDEFNAQLDKIYHNMAKGETMNKEMNNNSCCCCTSEPGNYVDVNLNSNLNQNLNSNLNQNSNSLTELNAIKTMNPMRPTKVDYYLDIAKQVCKRSTCLRRRFGAVIVTKGDKIIATGYNGAIRKAKDCLEIGVCMRQALKIPPGQRYELCKSFHAEQNAILAADPIERRGATLYLHGETVDGSPSYCEPCMMCKRTIVQGEIAKVIGRQPDGTIREWDVHEFIVEENLGKNFPKEIKDTNEFREYMKRASE
ncbi:AAA family ATPase [Candidatus Woesearchaeota archaeon]|nr:AAA family ATPase [Candidatus Woesearchaeota archaeon]